MNPILGEWSDDNTNEDEYDGDHDDKDMSRPSPRYPIAPLRLQQGNGTPLVGTVTKKDPKGLPIKQEQEQTHTSTKRAPGTTTTSITIPPQNQSMIYASGLSQPLLKYPDQRTLHLEGHYYIYVRNFLAQHKILMECACVTSHKLEQENDLLLMDTGYAKTKDELSDPIIRTINYCRSYLKVKCF